MSIKPPARQARPLPFPDYDRVLRAGHDVEGSASDTLPLPLSSPSPRQGRLRTERDAFSLGKLPPLPASWSVVKPERRHTSPYRGKGAWRGRRSQPSLVTVDQRAAPLSGLRRGWPVGALAASSSGGTCAADPPAAPSLQVLAPCVLFNVPMPFDLFHTGHVPGDRPCRRAGYGSEA